MKSKLLPIFSVLFFLISSCGGDTVEQPSKKEISQREKTGDTKDYCEIFNWYNDGQCDEFCIKPDGDCDVSCNGLPGCGPGTVEVSECTDLANCEERTVCGSTIYCEPDPCATAGAPPMCPQDYYAADSCETEDQNACIELTDACSGTIFCNPAVGCFAALPSCEQGSFEVEKCRINDSLCTEVAFACGPTISCAVDRDCDAIPNCQADEVMYRSKAECQSGSASCRQDYLCSDSIWCGGQGDCAVPDCGDLSEAPNCTDPEKCIEIFGCGTHVVCEQNN